MAFVWGHRHWDGIYELYIRLRNLLTLRCYEPYGSPKPIHVSILTYISASLSFLKR